MRSDRNKLVFNQDLLTVRPQGLDHLWCFRRELSFPLSAVKNARVAQKNTLRRGVRILGTDFGFKICGTYLCEGEKNFWNYRSPGPALVIELNPGHPFSRLIISVEAPEAVAEQLRQRGERIPPLESSGAK